MYFHPLRQPLLMFTPVFHDSVGAMACKAIVLRRNVLAGPNNFVSNFIHKCGTHLDSWCFASMQINVDSTSFAWNVMFSCNSNSVMASLQKRWLCLDTHVALFCAGINLGVDIFCEMLQRGELREGIGSASSFNAFVALVRDFGQSLNCSSLWSHRSSFTCCSTRQSKPRPLQYSRSHEFDLEYRKIPKHFPWLSECRGINIAGNIYSTFIQRI